MADQQVTWGIVATIKADTQAVLDFAAYHLELGAHRLHIYLDEPNPTTYALLKAHPKIRVQSCDERYWKQRNGKRPATHQHRQTVNATHAYERIQTDWIAHIDVDEYIWPTAPLEPLLGALPADTPCARIRPIEALAGRANEYKAFIPDGPDREAVVRAIYPTYGVFLKGGFLSHVAGKLFARTGLENAQFRIHNLRQDKETNLPSIELPEVDLCHHHAHSWEQWSAVYRFRLQQGSYRAGLASGFPRAVGGMNKHELLSMIEEEQGVAGLQRFYEEISATDPQVYHRLADRGMLRNRPLDLARKRRKHFPDFG